MVKWNIMLFSNLDFEFLKNTHYIFHYMMGLVEEILK